jgi:hypothetical protein
MELEVDVEGVERTLNEIERDLHRGMEKSMDNLVDNTKGRARRVIAETDSIFNAEVYKGFKDAETKNSSTKVRAKVYNDVGHADALEHGATYGSEGPPVAALLPWVARKMHWSPDFDLDSDGGDDSGGGSGNKKSVYINSFGEYDIQDGYTVVDNTKLEYDDLHFDQSVEVINNDWDEVKTGTIKDIEYTSDKYNFILEVEGTDYYFGDGERRGFRFISREPFEFLDKSEQLEINKTRLRHISFDSALQDKMSEIYETYNQSLFNGSKDQTQVKRQLDSIKSFNEYTGSKYAASVSRTSGISENKNSDVNYKDSNNRATIVHEYFHVYHNSNNFIATQPAENNPDWDFKKDGTSDSSFHDAWTYLLRDISDIDTTTDLDDAEREDYFVPGYEQGLSRAVTKHYSDPSPNEVYSLNTDKTATDLFEPGNIGLEDGDIFQITTTNGNVEQFKYHGIDARDQGDDRWEIPATGWGGTHDTVIFAVDDDGNPKGDVSFDGVLDVSVPKSDLELNYQWDNRQLDKSKIPFDTEISESDLYDDGYQMEPGDVLRVDNIGEGEEQVIKLEEMVEVGDDTVIKGQDYDRRVTWFFKGETSEEVFSNYELLGYYSPESKIDITLEEDNPRDRLIEAANITWLDMAYQVSTADKGDNFWFSDIDWVGRRYSSKAAHETLTTVSELLTVEESDPENYLTEANVINLYQNYPWLVEAWSVQWPLSDLAKNALEKAGANIDEDGIVRTGN